MELELPFLSNPSKLCVSVSTQIRTPYSYVEILLSFSQFVYSPQPFLTSTYIFICKNSLEGSQVSRPFMPPKRLLSLICNQLDTKQHSRGKTQKTLPLTICKHQSASGNLVRNVTPASSRANRGPALWAYLSYSEHHSPLIYVNIFIKHCILLFHRKIKSPH